MAEITADLSSAPAREECISTASHILTPSPSHSSGETSPVPNENEEQIPTSTGPKKKKKKKSKKSAKTKEAAAAAAKASPEDLELNRPPVLCISRNKHWRYISSYHVRDCSSFPAASFC